MTKKKKGKKPVEVLTQDEITQLLNAINNGDADPDDFGSPKGSRRIKIYDFMRPDRFSKDHIWSITNLHESLAQAWENQFAGYLQKTVKIKVDSVDQLTYEEFIRSVPNPSTIINSGGVLNSVPLPLSFAIQIDPCLLKLEKSALEDLGKSLLNDYSLAWCKEYGINMDYSLQSTATNPRSILIDSPQEMGVLVSFDTKIGAKKGMINIFLPYLFIKPLMPYLGGKIKGKTDKNIIKNKEEEAMADRNYLKPEVGLDNLKVQLVVEIGRTIKTMKEVKGIGEGSIVELDSYAGDAVSVYLNNVLFARGEVVVTEDKFAVRVCEIMEPADDGSNKGI
jgi:flagellar motor switch protein FliM